MGASQFFAIRDVVACALKTRIAADARGAVDAKDVCGVDGFRIATECLRVIQNRYGRRSYKTERRAFC